MAPPPLRCRRRQPHSIDNRFRPRPHGKSRNGPHPGRYRPSPRARPQQPPPRLRRPVKTPDGALPSHSARARNSRQLNEPSDRGQDPRQRHAPPPQPAQARRPRYLRSHLHPRSRKNKHAHYKAKPIYELSRSPTIADSSIVARQFWAVLFVPIPGIPSIGCKTAGKSKCVVAKQAFEPGSRTVSVVLPRVTTALFT